MEGKVGEGIDVIINKMVDAGNIEKAGYGVYAPRDWAKLTRGEEAARKVREMLNK